MRWFVLLWLIGLGVVVGLGVLRTGVFDLVIELPVDLDLLLVVTSIILVVAGALGISFKQGMDRLRQISVEKARAEAFAEHRRFLLRLDHELKNPLTAIRAGIVNLSEIDAAPEQKQVLASMDTQSLRLSRLVNDLRKLAEIETLPLELDFIDIAGLLSESVELFHERAEATDRKLILTPPPLHLPAVQGDRDLLLVALHNLLDNAFKFTRPGDRIELRATVDGEVICIEVLDTGIGIPGREVPLVWEELYRGKGAAGTLGSGVGLALVQVIVKRTGGRVSIASQVGHGTQVRLQLPITPS